MKIQAKMKAFYNGKIVKPGETIEFNEKKIPTWGTLADGESTPEQTKATATAAEKEKLIKRCQELEIGGNLASCGIPKLQEKIAAKEAEIANAKSPVPPAPPTSVTPVVTPDDGNNKTGDDADANNADKLGKLDALITQAIEKNINFEPENKTIQEQINELEKAIADAK